MASNFLTGSPENHNQCCPWKLAPNHNSNRNSKMTNLLYNNMGKISSSLSMSHAHIITTHQQSHPSSQNLYGEFLNLILIKFWFN
jgi:hypothetical protein